MRAVVQRVREASVVVNGGDPREIGTGLVVLVGVEEGDGDEDAAWLARKVVRMRIFADDEGLMNLPLTEVVGGGELLVVSQFTLHSSTKRGNRPSFITAAKPPEAVPLYEAFLRAAEGELGKAPVTGEFGAGMQVSLCNDGPVTILLDSRRPE